jgi:hypothetical protein
MCLHRLISNFIFDNNQDFSHIVANGSDKRPATREDKRQVTRDTAFTSYIYRDASHALSTSTQ